MTPGQQILLVFFIYIITGIVAIPVFRKYRVKIKNRGEREDCVRERARKSSFKTPVILKTLEEIDRLGDGLSHRERGALFEVEVKNLFNGVPGARAYGAREYAEHKGIALVGQDQGADVIVERFEERDGKRELIAVQIIQCKLYTTPVGNKAVQEVLGAIGKFNGFSNVPKRFPVATVITNNYFTKEAIDLADANNVELVDREKLGELIYAVKEFKGEVGLEENDTDFNEYDELDDENVA